MEFNCKLIQQAAGEHHAGTRQEITSQFTGTFDPGTGQIDADLGRDPRQLVQTPRLILLPLGLHPKVLGERQPLPFANQRIPLASPRHDLPPNGQSGGGSREPAPSLGRLAG